MSRIEVKFLAKNVVSYVEDEVCVVAFSDSKEVQPEEFLILSQTLFNSGDDDEEISVQFRGKKGVEGSVNLPVSQVRIGVGRFYMKLAVDGGEVFVFNINLDAPLGLDTLDNLRSIFEKSNVAIEFI